MKITSLVVGQIFNFSTGRCARHTAEVRATLKFARKVARASPSPAKFSGREKIKEDINFRKKSYKMRQYKEINFHGKTKGFRAETSYDLRELRTILRGKGEAEVRAIIHLLSKKGFHIGKSRLRT